MTSRSPTPKQLDTALLILRVVVAAVFIGHGGQKLFVYGFAGITAGFSKMGIPLPALMGPYITVLEFFGGIAVGLGFLTRILGLLLALDMLGAITFVHAKNGFFAPTGMEFPLSLLAMSAALALLGGGSWSLDALRARGASHAS